MTQTKLLSLKEAILININIMLGSGIFINTVLLAKNTGLLSGGLYLINGILVLPLILSMAALMHIHPRGGFYAFGSQELSPFAGFLSVWSYFVGKLASATLMLHIALSLVQTIVPILKTINILLLDCIVLCLFIFLNLMRMSIGISLQSATFVIKLIPIFFIIISGLFFMSPGEWIMPDSLITILQCVPLVLYTSLGFEATLSLSEKIENPQVNGPRAIMAAFAIIIGLSALFQTFFYLILGDTLAQQPNYLFAFPALLNKLHISAPFSYYLSSVFHLAIASSALGSAYGILFSTHWNFYTIAQNGHVFFHTLFTKLNTHALPFAGIILQGIVCLFYIAITRGNQVPLQIVASFGCVISYTISILALLQAHKKRAVGISPWIARLALLICGFFIATNFYNLLAVPIKSFLLFTTLLILGICMFYTTQILRKKEKPAL